MHARHFVLTIALITALVFGGAARADLNYRAEITGAEDNDLASLLDKVSGLKTLEDKPPVSEEALRRRADRGLRRLSNTQPRYTLDPGPVMRFGPAAVSGLERLNPAYVEGRLRAGCEHMRLVGSRYRELFCSGTSFLMRGTAAGAQRRCAGTFNVE